MSDTPDIVSPKAQPAQQGEELALGKVALVGISSILVFAAGIIFSTYLLNWQRAQSVRKPAVPVNRYEVGIVNQKSFALDPRADVKRDQQLQYLHGYGWVDRKAGTIHIPIEQAMRSLLTSQQTGPFGAAAAATVHPEGGGAE